MDLHTNTPPKVPFFLGQGGQETTKIRLQSVKSVPLAEAPEALQTAGRMSPLPQEEMGSAAPDVL